MFEPESEVNGSKELNKDQEKDEFVGFTYVNPGVVESSEDTDHNEDY